MRRERRTRCLLLETLEDRRAPALAPLSEVAAALDGVAADRWVLENVASSADGQLVVFETGASNLAPGDGNNQNDIFLYDRSRQRVSLISVTPDGLTSGDGKSTNPTISPDGRFVAFETTATNLVAGIPDVGVQTDIVVRDLQTGTTQLVSLAASGTLAGDLSSVQPQFSADGNHLLFASDARNLVTGFPPITGRNLYIRDLLNQTTRLVTVDRTGARAAGGVINGYSISAGGDYVAFSSTASDLVALDENGLDDIFVRDMNGQATHLVTVDPSGGFSANGHSWLTESALSADGRLVVWQSNASNHVTNDFNNASDVFVRDLRLGVTSLVSGNAAGTSSAAGTSVSPRITPSGQFVVFQSTANNLLGNGLDNQTYADIYVRDLVSGDVQLASLSTANQVADSHSYHGTISPDGRFVGFTTNATNLVAEDHNSLPDAYVRDLQNGITRLASPDSNGVPLGINGSRPVSVSYDGQYVALAGWNDDTALGDANRFQDVYVTQPASAAVELASRRYSEFDVARLSEGGGVLSDVSADGRYVVLLSYAWNCAGSFCSQPAPNDLDPATPALFNWTNVYVRDRVTGAVDTISKYHDGSQWRTGQGNAFNARISDDGRFTVFAHGGIAGVHAPFDPGVLDNNSANDVFFHDRDTNTTEMLSTVPQHTVAANGHSGATLVMSGDGRYVAYTSAATDLTDDDDTNNALDLFLWDRNAQTTTLVSRSREGGAATGGVSFATFSEDGSTLVFISNASDLVPNLVDENTSDDVFAYDLATGLLTAVSVIGDGSSTGNGNSGGQAEWWPVVSQDGRYITFASLASNLSDDDGNSVADVFRRDLATGETVLVSVSQSGVAAGGIQPSISMDGLRIAFASSSTQLVDNLADNNFALDVFVRDTSTSQTHLVSADPTTTHTGSASASGPRISPDGRYVAFESLAADLVTGFVDGNAANQPDIFLRDLMLETTTLVSANRSGTASGNAATPNASTFTLDASTLIFQSPASDIWINDVNTRYDVFAHQIGGSASISGRLFNDDDRNGLWGPSENGLAYWTVFLDTNHNGVLDEGEERRLTDVGGGYTFGELKTGTYRVAIRHPDTHDFTVPLAGYDDVSLSDPGVAVTDQDFGVFLPVPDVAVVTAGGSASAPVGKDITVTWTVTNVGQATAASGWQDAVYLSRDGALGPAAILLGTVAHTTELTPGEQRQVEHDFTLPPVVPDDYFVVVLADRRRQVSGDPDRVNNQLAAADTVAVTVDSMELDEVVTGSFDDLHGARYYQIEIQSRGTLLIEFANLSATGSHELALARGALPDDRTQTARVSNIQVDGELLLADAEPGTYYLRVRNLAGPATQFDVVASQPGQMLRSVTPTVVGTAGPVTFSVKGIGLTPTTVYALRGAQGDLHSATAVRLSDSTLAYVTFDVAGLPPGSYQLQALDHGQEFVLPSVIQVVVAEEPELTTRLIGPVASRAGRLGQFYVVYGNAGQNDIIAPLLSIVSNTNTRLGLQRDGVGSIQVLTVLGISEDEPAGRLRPGTEFRLPVYFEAPLGDYEFSLQVVRGDDSRAIDWEDVEQRVSLARTSRDDWDGVFAALKARIGTTWGDYVRALADGATQMPSAMGDSRDPYQLLELLAMQAAATVDTSLSGVVISDAAATAFAGRTIRATHLESGQAVSTIILTDGAFVFESLPAGTYQLACDGATVISGESLVISPHESVHDWELTLGSQPSITVLLVTAETGDPLEGATVVARDAAGVAYSATPLGNGEYRVTGLPPGMISVFADSPGRARAAFESQIDDQSLAYRIPMHHESIVVAMLDLGTGGPPDPSFVFEMQSLTEPQLVFASSDALQLAGLPGGIYEVRLLADGYVPFQLPLLAVPAGQTLDLGTIALDLPGSVSGHFSSSHPLYPSDGALVGAFLNDTLVATAVTDATGTFLIDGLAPDTYTIRFAIDTPFAIDLDVVVSSGEQVEGVNIGISPGGSIHGTVTDSRTGNPLSGIVVTGVGSGGLVEVAFTAMDGSYELASLPVDQYEVYLSLAGPQSSHSVVIDSLDAMRQVDLLFASAATLTGIVRMADGQPVADATVQLLELGHAVGSAESDETGRYSFSLVQAGEYELRAGAYGMSFPATTNLQVMQDAEVQLDISAGDADITITGMDLGQPAEGAEVTLFQHIDTDLLVAGYGQLDASGQIVLSDLAPGTYTIDIKRDGVRGTRQTITLAAAESAELTLQLLPQFRIQGVIRDGDGNPIADATVLAMDMADPLNQAIAATDSDGVYALHNVPSGTYDLVVTATGFRALTVVGQSVTSVLDVDLELQPADSELHGHVVDPAGGPVRDAWVTVTDAQGHVLGRAITDLDGLYAVAGIVGQDLEVTVGAISYAPEGATGVVAPGGQITTVADVVLQPRSLGDPSWWDIFLQALDHRLLNWKKVEDDVKQFEKHSDHVEDGEIPPPPPPVCEQSCEDAYQRALREKRDQDSYFDSANAWKDGTLQATKANFSKVVHETITNFQTILELVPAIGAAKKAWYGLRGIEAATEASKLSTATRIAVIQLKRALGPHNRTAINILSRANALRSAFQSVIDSGQNEPKNTQVSINNAIKAKVNLSKEINALIFDVATALQAITPDVAKELRKFGVTALGGLGKLIDLESKINALQFNDSEKAAQWVDKTYERFKTWRRLYELKAPAARQALNAYLACLENAQKEDPENCKPKKPNPKGNPGGGFHGSGAGSYDPNDITGPAGFGPHRYVTPGDLMPYLIRFENDPLRATAPAQEVTIQHQLDADLDWASLELDSFGFGDLVVNVPRSTQQLEQRVPYHNPDGSALDVDVRVQFDPSTGIVSWTFQSVDPQSGSLPDGVFDGFLPPNHSGGQGEGYVSFFVRSAIGGATGDLVEAEATIVFDTNEPIHTNQFINKLDAKAPESGVIPLPSVTRGWTIPVAWSGSDDGAGIVSYDVFVSDNSGPFALWLDDTPATTGEFPGEDGHTYRFYSVATDGVGNQESAPPQFDAETTLDAPLWQNRNDRFDTNGDGKITTRDILLIINRLARTGGDASLPDDGSQPPPFLDTNGDERITSLDALLIINHLTRLPVGEGEGQGQEQEQGDAEGEGEAASAFMAPCDAVLRDWDEADLQAVAAAPRGPDELVDTRGAALTWVPLDFPGAWSWRELEVQWTVAGWRRFRTWYR